jgi:hypothetical protein
MKHLIHINLDSRFDRLGVEYLNQKQDELANFIKSKGEVVPML